MLQAMENEEVALLYVADSQLISALFSVTGQPPAACLKNK